MHTGLMRVELNGPVENESRRNTGLLPPPTKNDPSEWQEEDYMPPHLISYHETVPEIDDVRLKEIYIERQLQFYNKCMAYLKHEKVTWTAITDTDGKCPSPFSGISMPRIRLYDLHQPFSQ